MIHKVRRHVSVEQDLLDLASWIARDSEEAAYRFLDAAEKALYSLRVMPLRGSLKQFHNRKLAGVRICGIAGFPNHIVIYQMRSDDVFVLAIVHGARLFARVLKERV